MPLRPFGTPMNWLAIKMLTGDRGKYLGIVAGITFASLLIAQQSSIFCGLMSLTRNAIVDINDPNIWVMDNNVEYIDGVRPLSDDELYLVRSVTGVQWAARLYKGQAKARLPSGEYEQVKLYGLGDDHLVGGPDRIVLGELSDLWKPDAVMMDTRGYHRLWPGEPYRTGRVFEMNDRRAVLVGICQVSQTFESFPVVYTRYTEALQYVPPERKLLSYVVARSEPDVPADEVCQRIERQTSLKALTSEEFEWMTIRYYLRETGIPVNFGITVALGFLVGTAIAAQTFYLFTVENKRQFAALKAMGARNSWIVRALLLQAAMVGGIGYGIGVGLAAVFAQTTQETDRLAFLMPWQVLLGTGVAVVVMVMVSALLSIRSVLALEPATVFQEG